MATVTATTSSISGSAAAWVLTAPFVNTDIGGPVAPGASADNSQRNRYGPGRRVPGSTSTPPIRSLLAYQAVTGNKYHDHRPDRQPAEYQSLRTQAGVMIRNNASPASGGGVCVHGPQPRVRAALCLSGQYERQRDLQFQLGTERARVGQARPERQLRQRLHRLHLPGWPHLHAAVYDDLSRWARPSTSAWPNTDYVDGTIHHLDLRPCDRGHPADDRDLAALATPNPVTGTTTNLSVLGADIAGESTLTYNWAAKPRRFPTEPRRRLSRSTAPTRRRMTLPPSTRRATTSSRSRSPAGPATKITSTVPVTVTQTLTSDHALAAAGRRGHPHREARSNSPRMGSTSSVSRWRVSPRSPTRSSRVAPGGRSPRPASTRHPPPASGATRSR